MNAELATKTLKYVQASGALAKRALDDRNVLAADREKAAAGRDQLISAMLSAETIGDGQQEKAAEMLGTHAGTSQLLKAAIDKIAELSTQKKQAGALGEGVDPSVVDGSGQETKEANGNYVGFRGSEKKASDHAILAVLDAPGG